MEIIIFSLVLVLFAGVINGSFATPMKYMTKWDEENIWFIFSFSGFLILPWLSIYFMSPNVGQVLNAIPSKLLWTMIFGGLAFGIGQIAFATSFRYIGIGLAFVINISMGTSGSALIPILWHKGIMGTAYSYVQIVGIIVFIIAVCFGAAAGAARERHKKDIGDIAEDSKARKIKPGMLLLGVILAIIAGAGSVCQGVTYIWANPAVRGIASSQSNITDLAGSVIAWVVIFSAAWVPYAIYFLILNIKNKSFSKIATSKTGKYWLFTILMGIGFWGSLIFFSKAADVIGGDLAPTIAWPLFMVFIILTSNFWSWKSGEWRDAGSRAMKRMTISLALFVAAIIVFSYSSSLQPKNPATPDDHHHDVKYKFLKHDNYPSYRFKR